MVEISVILPLKNRLFFSFFGAERGTSVRKEFRVEVTNKKRKKKRKEVVIIAELLTHQLFLLKCFQVPWIPYVCFPLFFMKYKLNVVITFLGLRPKIVAS